MEKENFDMVIENIAGIAGSFIAEYCTGMPKDGRITLPPLKGIEEDFLTLYKSS